MAFLEGPGRREADLRHGRPGEGQYAAELLPDRPPAPHCLVEKNALRRGLISPGMHIPVVMEDELHATPDVYYVLAWNFKKEILAQNQQPDGPGRGILLSRSTAPEGLNA